MDEVKLILNDKGQGGFIIRDEQGHKKIAEMVMSIAGDKLTVYHTEVLPEAEGKGYAKKLLDTMVAYAREHKLKVIPLCPFVHAQFKRHPENFSDIWERSEEL